MVVNEFITKMYEAILWYMNVYETVGIYLRQYDGI